MIADCQLAIANWTLSQAIKSKIGIWKLAMSY